MSEKKLSGRALVVFFLVYALLYVAFRPAFLLLFLITLPISALLTYLYVFLSKKSPNFEKYSVIFLKVLVVISSTAYLVLCFFYYRISSYDGLLWYLRRYLNLIKEIPLYILEFPQPPYLSELFLALVYKLANQNYVNLTFGLFSIASLFLLNYFFRQANVDKKVRALSLITFALAPMFYILALLEFKTEIFFLFCVLTTYILFVKYLDKPKLFTGVFLGLSIAVTALVKVSFLPISVLLSLILAFEAFRSGKLFPFFLAIGTETAVLITWILFFGFSIPWTTFNIYPINITKQVQLSREPDLYKKCVGELKVIDFDQYLFDENRRQIIFQPFYYMFSKIPQDRYFTNLDPGVFLYISIWLFPFTLYINLKKGLRKKPLIYLDLVSGIYIAIFFITARTLYWYLIPVFPITLLTLYNAIYVLVRDRRFQYAILTIVFGILGVYFINLLTFSYQIINKQSFFILDYPKLLRLEENMKISEYIQNDKSGILFMDLTPHTNFLVSFPNNYYRKVVPSNLYFGSTTKDFDEIYKELKQNNIGYLVYDNQEPKKLKYYGCPLTELERSKSFIDKYTQEIYKTGGDGIIYKIN